MQQRWSFVLCWQCNNWHQRYHCSSISWSAVQQQEAIAVNMAYVWPHRRAFLLLFGTPKIMCTISDYHPPPPTIYINVSNFDDTKNNGNAKEVRDFCFPCSKVLHPNLKGPGNFSKNRPIAATRLPGNNTASRSDVQSRTRDCVILHGKKWCRL